MEPTLSVRYFDDSDALALTGLLHDAYAELGRMGLNYTAVDQDEETTCKRASGGQCWIVEQDHRLVASLTMSYPPSLGLRGLTPVSRDPRRAWLNQVAVSPAARGRGIAAHLWLLGRAWAVEQGATSVGVDTAVPADHLVRLYTRWGFAYADTIHWPGKTYDSVVMVRSLTNEDL